MTLFSARTAYPYIIQTKHTQIIKNIRTNMLPDDIITSASKYLNDYLLELFKTQAM